MIWLPRRSVRLTRLAALAALGALCASLAGLLAAALILQRRLGVPMWQVVAAGTPVALITAGLTAFSASRFARQLRILRAEAARRVTEPTYGGGQRRLDVPPWAGAELSELARALDGLVLRLRLADELAERHRRLAETSSAGMFELLSGLVDAEEGARGQLAAELHDTVAQSLMSARVLLAEEGPPDPQRAALVTDLVAEAEEQVRAVMARTRPPALREGDLARAVAGLRDELRGRYGIEVAVSWPPEPHPLPLATAVTVYRFFQEALLNVVKHADVDSAQASLTVEPDWVIAAVSDTGPGFDPGQVRSDGGRHVGLGLLRERARLLGGALDLDSWPSKGTTVTLRLPRGAGAAPSLLPGPRMAAVT